MEILGQRWINGTAGVMNGQTKNEQRKGAERRSSFASAFVIHYLKSTFVTPFEMFALRSQAKAPFFSYDDVI